MAKSIHPAWLLTLLLLLPGCGGGDGLDFSVAPVERGGKRAKLSDYKGKVVVIDFWATWCGPCVISMPAMDTLYRKYKDKDVVVMGVSQEERSKITEFLKTRPVSYPMFIDDSGGMGGPSKLFDTNVLPTVVLIDRKGNAVYKQEGFDGSTADLEKEIDKVL